MMQSSRRFVILPRQQRDKRDQCTAAREATRRRSADTTSMHMNGRMRSGRLVMAMPVMTVAMRLRRTVMIVRSMAVTVVRRMAVAVVLGMRMPVVLMICASMSMRTIVLVESFDDDDRQLAIRIFRPRFRRRCQPLPHKFGHRQHIAVSCCRFDVHFDGRDHDRSCLRVRLPQTRVSWPSVRFRRLIRFRVRCKLPDVRRR